MLSEPEFLDRLLEATTGLAHELVFDWKNSNDNTASIYHGLISNFDIRMPGAEAKRKLHEFVIHRNSNLAKAEAEIQRLVVLAGALLPKGESQNIYKDMEGCTSLIRALPPYSRMLADNLYKNYTTRLQRTCTMQELFRGLNQYRESIDSDIKANGAISNGTYKNKRLASRYKNNYSSFNISSDLDRNRSNRQLYSPPNNRQRTRQNDVSFTPKPKPVGIVRPQRSRQNRNFNNKGVTYRGPNNYNNNRSCSLCGYSNHRTTDCKNIKDDSGKILDMLPTYGVCSKCPAHVKPRLHHPEMVCPYRVGGPFHNKQNKN